MSARKGFRALVTSGPTHEPIDPVRFLGNRSSGRQGHAIAAALRDAGAKVVLVTGPVALPDPEGVEVRHVITAREMLAACRAALPVEVAVCAAAVADWRPVAPARQKLKKKRGAPVLALMENPDILATLAKRGPKRPALVVGFAAETQRVAEQARAKRVKKGCDWIVANDVSGGKGFDASENEVMLITEGATQRWPKMSKEKIAVNLVREIVSAL
jgi:phosphopantothenoylcysteine decarboxylase/phosphopantothenate--cysteine ligase